jgi:hypothetical protein
VDHEPKVVLRGNADHALRLDAGSRKGCFTRMGVPRPAQSFFGVTGSLSAMGCAHYHATSLFKAIPTPTFVLFIECDPVPSTPLRSIQVAARDAEEAECAAYAIADFVFAAVAQDVTIHIHDLAAAREIKAVRRPVSLSI